jgi:KaiC/GvpD/RAD55 family RecA-like ATPase
MRIDLLPTGVEPVDSLVGGIAAGEITLVSGVPQSGKTCLALSCLVTALGRGEGACLVTTDEPTAVIQFCSKYLGVDLEPKIRGRELTILTYGPGFENKIRSLGTIDKPAGELGMIGSERAVKCLVFDTVDPILVATDASKLKQFVRATINSILGLKATCLCTSAAASGGDTLKLGAQELGAQVSCSIDLRRNGEQRFLNVAQASWCQLDASLLPVELVHGKGMVSAGPPRTAATQIVSAPSDHQPMLQNVATVMLEVPTRGTPTAPPIAAPADDASTMISDTPIFDGPAAKDEPPSASARALKRTSSLSEVLSSVGQKLDLPKALKPRVGEFYSDADSKKPEKK